MNGQPAVILLHTSHAPDVRDETGRVIAPAQAEPPVRAHGLLDEDTRLDTYEAIQHLANELGSYRKLLTLVRNIAYVATGEKL